MLATCSRICPSLQQRPPLIRHPDLPSNEFQCVQAKRSSRKLVRNWRRDRAGECLSDAFWPANRPTPAASQEQPRAQNRETGGELAHRSLITDVLQFRRQAADQCPPEPRARASTFRKWRFASFPLTAQKADSAKRWKQNSNFKA